jgi:hypothetical protein
MAFGYTVPVAGPIRLEAQDVALSRPKQGFDSPMGHIKTAASYDAAVLFYANARIITALPDTQ